MGKGDYLGEFEMVVMLTLGRLGARAYGMTIRLEIEERTGRSVSIGAVYTTLRRLQRKGFVSSALGEPSPSRGGRTPGITGIGMRPTPDCSIQRTASTSRTCSDRK